MTQAEKDLLLKDLYARLPYGVKVQGCKEGRKFTGEVVQINGGETGEILIRVPTLKNICGVFNVNSVKPYLFPLSSLTERQCDELYKIAKVEYDDFCNLKTLLIHSANLVNWCMQNHIDINGLIPMGLAKDATEKNIY